MRGTERLRAVELTTEPLRQALPALPRAETVLIRLLRISGYGLGDFFLQVFRNMGLTEIPYHVLCILVASKEGRAYPSELSELVGTSRATMTNALAVLEQRGYVTRESSELDARRNLVIITKQGADKVNEMTPELVEPITAAFSKLTLEEQETLDKLLRKAIVSFDEAKQQSGSVL